MSRTTPSELDLVHDVLAQHDFVCFCHRLTCQSRFRRAKERVVVQALVDSLHEVSQENLLVILEVCCPEPCDPSSEKPQSGVGVQLSGMSVLPPKKITVGRHVPIWIDPRMISTGRCFDGRRCRINIHLVAPYGVLAYSGCRAIDRLGFYDRWRRHGHPLGRNLIIFAALFVLVFIAALLSILVTTRPRTALVGLAFLSSLSLDDLLEECIS